LEIKRAVVTGGLGFIGSHLVDCLLGHGIQVIVLDNLATGRRANLEQAKNNPNLTIFEVDLASPPAWAHHFKGADAVFHLAALADIVPSLQKPLDYYHANVTTTAHVLEAARWQGVKKLVYVASSSCYGISKIIPTPETAPIQPEYPYALTKYLGEQLVLHWGKVYKMPVISCRLFNVYGPRSRTTGAYGAVFGVFLRQKLAGQPLTVVGDGQQTRDFTYVTDVVNALWMAATNSCQGEVFNVGSGKTQPVNYLVELIGGPKTFIPKRPGEPDCTFADTSKIQRMLQWSPQVSFEQGVQRMLDVIQDWKEAPLWTPDSIQASTREWFQYLTPSQNEVNASHE
jgi:UDP-glucose 4-epimerase